MRSPRRSLLAPLLALAALVLPLAVPATRVQAQIGTPVDLGSAEADFSLVNSLSITTSGVPTGASIIVVAVTQPGPPPSSVTCSDGAGNAYTTDVSENNGQALTTICATHRIATPLGNGATITVTWSGGTGRTQNQRMRAFAVTGLASGALDVTSSASFISAAPSSGTTAMTTQANELLVGAITNSIQTAAGAGFSPGTNGTTNTCSNTGSQTYTALPGVGTSNLPSLFGMYCIVGAAGQYEARGTFGSGAALWQALLATYKEGVPHPDEHAHQHPHRHDHPDQHQHEHQYADQYRDPDQHEYEHRYADQYHDPDQHEYAHEHGDQHEYAHEHGDQHRHRHGDAGEYLDEHADAHTDEYLHGPAHADGNLDPRGDAVHPGRHQL